MQSLLDNPIVDELEKLFPRATVSTNPADFAKAFNCLAGKTRDLKVSPELAFSVVAEFSHDAIEAKVTTTDELMDHYRLFKRTHPWSTEGVAAYAESLAELFAAKGVTVS